MTHDRGAGQGWWAGLSGLVVPVACAGCGRPDVALCLGCRDRLVSPEVREVQPAVSSGGLRVFSAARYEGAVRELMVAWKDGGRLDLTAPLAAALARVVDTSLFTADPGPAGAPEPVGHPERRQDGSARRLLLVPVPSSRAAVRRRGEDVLWELARRAAGSLTPVAGPRTGRGGPPVMTPGTAPGTLPGPAPDAVDVPGAPGGTAWGEVRAARLLAQRRGVRDQAGLATGERLANTAGRLRIRRSWDDWRFGHRAGGPAGRGAPVAGGSPVLLVDDIVTTGASLAAAAAALAAAGVTVLGAATVAWTPRRRVGTSVPDFTRSPHCRVPLRWSSVEGTTRREG